MPTYEFLCQKCKKVVELQRSMKDESPVLCCEESCGDIEMEQLISRSTFHLKGLGWSAEGYDKTGIT